MSIVKKTVEETKVRCLILSSNLLESVYDTATQVLKMTFRHGRVYEYQKVDPKVYQAFEQGESQGRVFSQYIKPLPNKRLNDVDTRPLLTEIEAKS